MNLRVLGCSGSVGRGLDTTSLLIDDDILIDAGTGVGELTYAEMQRIRHVFITHSHLDHLVSLPFLIDTLFGKDVPPLKLYARPETLTALRDHIFNWSIWPNFAELPSKAEPVLIFEEMRPGDSLQLGDREIEMFEVNHVVPGAGYYVHNGKAAFCFSGDTTTNDSMWAALNARDRLDLMIVEVGFGNSNRWLAEVSKHYCPDLLAEDIAKLRHRPRVAITHLKPGAEDQTYNECLEAIVGFDVLRLRGGDTFTL
jgi:ribonuclease BN (tRNA processing enzyme)